MSDWLFAPESSMSTKTIQELTAMEMFDDWECAQEGFNIDFIKRFREVRHNISAIQKNIQTALNRKDYAEVANQAKMGIVLCDNTLDDINALPQNAGAAVVAALAAAVITITITASFIVIIKKYGSKALEACKQRLMSDGNKSADQCLSSSSARVKLNRDIYDGKYTVKEATREMDRMEALYGENAWVPGAARRPEGRWTQATLDDLDLDTTAGAGNREHFEIMAEVAEAVHKRQFRSQVAKLTALRSIIPGIRTISNVYKTMDDPSKVNNYNLIISACKRDIQTAKRQFQKMSTEYGETSTTESWLFGSEVEPAQEGAITKWALNRAKHTGMKSKISTDQRKAFNTNIKAYIASHDPGEIARLAAQLYSKRKGYVTGEAGKARCEDIAKRQTSRKAKNVTIEMMNGLYYVTCMKPQEGGDDEFMFYCPQVNGVYSRTIHQMAWELVGAQGKSAYATESWTFD